MSDRKIIFLDVDGTLTEPGCNVPPDSAVKAVRQAQKNGHKVMLCTGRNYNMLKPLLKYGFDGFICSSGAYVQVGDQCVYDHALTDSQREEILAVLKQYGVFCTIEGKEGSYTEDGFKEFLNEHASEGSNSELLRWRVQLEKNLNIRPMNQYSGEPVYKIIFMGVDTARMAGPAEALREHYAVCLQEPEKYGLLNGEVVPKGLSKGEAIKKAAAYLNIDLKDTIGYGDSMNDKEMIKVVGHSVCMENGSETLKRMADEVCPAAGEDGIYRSFKENRLFL